MNNPKQFVIWITLTRALRFNASALNNKKKTLPQLDKGVYRYFKNGAQCVILEYNDEAHGNDVLLITNYDDAKKIELVRARCDSDQFKSCLAIPTLKGINENIGHLLNAQDPEDGLRKIRSQSSLNLRNLPNQNIVYSLPKFLGTLENIDSLRFKNDSYEKLREQLHLALEYLHSQRVAHCDISLRNIFYTGEYPNYQFLLGDFGKASDNPLTLEKNIAQDKQMLESVLQKIEDAIAEKYHALSPSRNNHQNYPLLFNALRKRKGLSPLDFDRYARTPVDRSRSGCRRKL